MTQRRIILATVLAGLLGGVVATFVKDALASRNSSGTYSLPAGNPVVTGTAISSTWANNTLSDIGTELTDSLNRSGKGPMLAALELVDGSVATPALSFDSDTDTGIFRSSANNITVACGGAGALTIGPTGMAPLVPVFAAVGSVTNPSYSFLGDANTGVYWIGADTIGIAANSALRLTVGTSGIIIGATGTALDDSYAAASTIDFASTSNTTTDSSGITVTGAAVGDTCTVGVPTAAAVAGASFTCYVSAADTVKVRFTAVGAGIDPASGSFNVRTFDP